jgi:hypothetical protein
MPAGRASAKYESAAVTNVATASAWWGTKSLADEPKRVHLIHDHRESRALQLAFPLECATATMHPIDGYDFLRRKPKRPIRKKQNCCQQTKGDGDSHTVSHFAALAERYVVAFPFVAALPGLRSATHD